MMNLINYWVHFVFRAAAMTLRTVLLSIQVSLKMSFLIILELFFIETIKFRISFKEKMHGLE